METHPEILIVGGGVIGLTTAWQLAGQGVSVTVVDRQKSGCEASWAGAGMLPPGHSVDAESPEIRLRSYSHMMWERLASDLRERTGIDNGYRRCGSIEISDVENARAFLDQVQLWRVEGIRVQELHRHGLEEHVPDLDPRFESGVFLPDFGQVRNPRHLKALVAACQSLGVEVLEDVPEVRLTVSGEATVLASTGQRTFAADRICIAAGSWSQFLLEPLGVCLPVKPVRGQIVQLRVPQLAFASVIELGRRYIVPRTDGLILIGSTEEHVGFEKRNTNKGVSGLLKFAESIVPELGRAEVVQCWAGLRPGSPDELPFLGQVPGFDNLFIGAGHFRSGLQMSPGTAAILGDLLLDRKPAVDITGLTCDRMASLQ